MTNHCHWSVQSFSTYENYSILSAVSLLCLHLYGQPQSVFEVYPSVCNYSYKNYIVVWFVGLHVILLYKSNLVSCFSFYSAFLKRSMLLFLYLFRIFLLPRSSLQYAFTHFILFPSGELTDLLFITNIPHAITLMDWDIGFIQHKTALLMLHLRQSSFMYVTLKTHILCFSLGI